MTLEFMVDPELTDRLRAEIVACWTDVVNAGGAVGFVPPVVMDDVLPTAEAQFAGVLAGRDRLVIGRATGGDPELADGRDSGPDGDAGAAGDGAGGRLAALAFLVSNDFAYTAHWSTVRRVMVHPDFQGLGYGYKLMAEVAAVARESGLEQLHLDCRGGTGNDLFYKKCGYTEIGRAPKAIRLPVQPSDHQSRGQAGQQGRPGQTGQQASQTKVKTRPNSRAQAGVPAQTRGGGLDYRDMVLMSIDL